MQKQILLYYIYTNIADPVALQAWQKSLGTDFGLVGRIIIATEGINGTVCGTIESTEQYIVAMQTYEPFKAIDFKKDIVSFERAYFQKFQVSIRSEIVNLGLDIKEYSASNGGEYLTPEQTHQLLEENPEDLVVLDGRNYYEARVGAFVNAVIPPVSHFRDFPEYIDANADFFKDKQVLMYCTGGVRCERASVYVKLKTAAKRVYQMHGGIVRYVEKYPDGYFRGKNYVFDSRITVKINEDVLSTCDLCACSCDAYTNCRNALCNKHFIACSVCIEKFNNACSEQCYVLLSEKRVSERPYRLA